MVFERSTAIQPHQNISLPSTERDHIDTATYYSTLPYHHIEELSLATMHFNIRRKSTDSSRSFSSSSSDLSDEILGMTLPMAPREDNYNMSEKQRQQRLFAKCKRAATEPWKSARPLPGRH